MTTTLEIQTTMMLTTSRTNWPEAGWRCVLEGDMALYVMTHGTIRMSLWSADNWVSPPMVRNVVHIIIIFCEVGFNHKLMGLRS